MPDADPREVRPGIDPAWLLAARGPAGSLWIAVDPAGRTAGFELVGDEVRRVPTEPPRLPAGTPPVLLGVEAGRARLGVPPSGRGATATHPIPLDDGSSVFVTRDGDVVRDRDGNRDRVAVDALPDARLVRAGDRVAVLAGATERYGHGVLGDRIEAESVALLSAADGLSIERTIEIPDGAVVEEIAPILADLTGDGESEVIVTESDPDGGARQVAYDLRGRRVAAGPPIGAGFRWRHALAVAPFGPDGVPELAVVRTPHIGGVVEFYCHDAGSLRIEASIPGYSSHEIGSRVLDGGLAADADGDGRVGLLVPTNDRQWIAAVRRTSDGATEAWRRSVGGTVRSNLAATALPDGGLAVGVARRDGTVRVWS